jgi:hypothetical protein
MSGDAAGVGQWETFYVIVGSSGGALTGLLFVVVALTADRVRAGTSQGLSAFTSPSIFHFCNVLFISAMIAMPRKSLTTLAMTLGLCALVGGFITVVAARRIARFERYQPVAEDWIWHAIIPCVSYIGLLVSAIMLPSATESALYGVGSVCLALLFVGIHNAWDAALYSATYIPKNQDTPA